MIDPTHQPFFDLVLRLNVRTKDEVLSFLEGQNEDQTLAKAFEFWSWGDTTKAVEVLTRPEPVAPEPE